MDNKVQILFVDDQAKALDERRRMLRFHKNEGDMCFATDDTPVVMLTGDIENDAMIKGYTQGCDYYINKPLHNDHLLNIVEYLSGDPTEQRKQELE